MILYVDKIGKYAIIYSIQYILRSKTDTHAKIPPRFDLKQESVSVTYPRPMAIYSHYDGDGRVFSYYTDNSVSIHKKNIKGIYEVAKKL